MFDSLLGPIFKDKAKLSPRYIPEVLPHREEGIALLDGVFEEILEKPSEASLRIAQVIGPVGTGKTCCCIRFGKTLEEAAKKWCLDLKHLYVNLKAHSGSRVVLYRHIVERCAREVFSRGFGAEELLYRLLKFLDKEEKYLFITLDEIDYRVKHVKDQVVYDLTRLNELYPEGSVNVLGLVFTARSREFHNLLDRAELSTLGRSYINFLPYTSSQIMDILEYRAKEALNPRVVSEEVLGYIADITARPPVNSDIRYALDLLLYSGNLAERKGHETILTEDVRAVHGETYPHITSEDILNLSDRGKLALMAVVRQLQVERSPYATLKDIRAMFDVVCEELDLKYVEDKEEYIQDLHDRGIIEIESLKRIGISGAPTKELERFLTNLVERIREGLG